MTVLAAIRTGHVGLPLFFHVLGAMLLVGTLLVVSSAILLGWRREGDGSAALTRHGLRTVFYGVLPAYVVMRVGAEWTHSAENLPDDYSPAWLDIGFAIADIGALVVLVSLVLSALGLRSLRRGGGIGLARAVGVLSVLMLAAYLVAVWAMAGKPG